MGAVRLGALPWSGGKSSATGNNTGIGRWIASLLPPPESQQTYCEPFAGMLGVLLQREPAGREIVNDLDGHIVNWWRCVRDKPKRLARMIAHTPNSRAEYAESVELLKAGTRGLKGALAFTVIAQQSFSYGSMSPGTYRTRWSPVGLRKWRGGIHDRLEDLAERMSEVTLENLDALEILRRIAHVSDAVIYLDPPYYTVSKKNKFYIHNDVDVKPITDLLLLQRGHVAISGYGDEWDHLNWEKHTFETIAPGAGDTRNSRATVPKRTECLWTNYVTEV